ncbi:hypothetical protein AB1Y20_009559 [Prymnesium parvum]|uniref:Uncharacterized protein n=1 Tax=Prymnesium parvum TaxID=97485 RepID=A0AB34K2D0_PRYPA
MEGEAMEKGTSSVEPQQHSGRQRLEAMSEQLEAVITCMRLEQQARCAAEEELRQTRELLDEAQKEIQCMDASREAEKVQSTSLLALLVKLEAENRDLKETNSQLAQECRLLLVKDAR